MVKVLIISTLMMALLAGMSWVYQTPAPATSGGSISPRSSAPALPRPDPVNISATGKTEKIQQISPAVPQQMTKRSDFLDLGAGDQILIQGRSRTNDLEDHVVAINSVSSQSESILIKGTVANGGAFVATLGPKSLNIFLQGARQVWRYSGAQFSGELAPLYRANLENDVRVRTPVQLERVDD